MATPDKAEKTLTLGQNIEATIKGNILTLVIDTSKGFGKSASGKSNIVATTSGNQKVPDTDGLVIGVNVYRPVNGK